MSSGRINWPLFAGTLLSLLGFLSFPLAFVKWPVTRDFPWANLLVFAAAAIVLGAGLRRAFAPGRSRIVRVVFALVACGISLAAVAQFVMMVFVAPRRLPASLAAPQVGQHAPEFTLPDETGASISLTELLTSPVSSARSAGAAAWMPRGVLLIFYMYSGCRACNSEFHEIQQHLEEFRAAGVRPVAISVDRPDVSRALSREAGYTFSFLSDPALDVIRRYDVVNPAEEMARPAEFLVGRDGIVRWRNLTSNYYVRARPAQILEAAKLLPSMAAR
jgi:peroxiredoxin